MRYRNSKHAQVLSKFGLGTVRPVSRKFSRYKQLSPPIWHPPQAWDG